MEILTLFLLVFCAVLLLVCLMQIIKLSKRSDGDSFDEAKLKEVIASENSTLRQELSAITQNSVNALGGSLAENQRQSADFQKGQLERLESRIHNFSIENEQKLENIRKTVSTSITNMQEDNNKQLNQIKDVVDEKLQKTLEEKMTNSFNMVNENLKKVYEGLGEMQSLATGVGDLKKVLTNVKTRGVLGEYQLQAILEEILAPTQYEVNAAVKKNSQSRVEFAIKLPGKDGDTTYLPIDSKFPGDTYMALVEATEGGDQQQIKETSARLIETIKREAKDIKDKYINPPMTTDFAIMFLPFEGLYAEVARLDLIEVLQREYKVNVAGPSTMAALLNSLQMGFKTLAIQKKSAEVWKTLSAVKTEFGKFSGVLDKTKQRLEQANKELDSLVGVRTRQIQSKLSKIDALDDETEAQKLLED